MSEKGNNLFEIKDLAGLSEPLCRVINCLDKGISSLAAPFLYKRMEEAKLLMEKKRADQNATVLLKEAMTQDLIAAARTTRDRLQIENISNIYGTALHELESFGTKPLPVELVKPDWAAHFYDCSKDCSEEEIRLLWSKILAGEISSPGKFFKRTLTCLKQLEKHEAEWFVNVCKYTIEDTYLPAFVLRDGTLPFNQFQSLVDCGLINATEGDMEIKEDSVLPLKSKKLHLNLKEQSCHIRVFLLTDSGMQLGELVNVETDAQYAMKLVLKLNQNNQVDAKVE